MYKFKTLMLLALSLVLFLGSSTCQNGPTAPTVVLTWTPGTPVTGQTVAQYCIYRGLVVGVYTQPAITCISSSLTTYTDTTVARGTTYHYAVTARSVTTESGYSNDAIAPVPLAPNAPTVGTPTEAEYHPPVGNDVVWLAAKVVYQ